MKVCEVMTREVRTVNPDQTIQAAAQLMDQMDTGALLVEQNDRLVGMITDRDITVRAVAKNCGGTTKIRDVMSTDIKYCFEDEEISHIAHNMAENQIRRLPVVNRDKRLVGIVSLGNIASSQDASAVNTLVQGIARPH